MNFYIGIRQLIFNEIGVLTLKILVTPYPFDKSLLQEISLTTTGNACCRCVLTTGIVPAIDGAVEEDVVLFTTRNQLNDNGQCPLSMRY